MAVRKRGSSFQADLTVKGQRYRETFATEQEATAWEHEVRAAIIAGKPIPRPACSTDGADPRVGRGGKGFSGQGSMTLADALERTKERYWLDNPDYLKKVEYTIGHLTAYFGVSMPIGAVTTEAIDGFIRECKRAGQSNGTVNRKLAVLSKCLRYCEERGIITKRPKIERERESQGRIRFLSHEEEQAFADLFAQWGKEDHLEAFTVLVDTGLRNSELWNLKGHDVDLKTNLITIWQNKTDHPRSVPMTSRVRAIIEKRKAAYKMGHLFPGADNYWFRNVWDRARGHLGYLDDPHMVPYICRHTCASRLVQRGVSLRIVADWLGHKSIQMTMRYAHLAPHNLQAAAAALEPEAAE